MRTADLDFSLPDAQIAQQPLAQRDASRLLVLDRTTQTWREDTFNNLPTYLRANDCLVLNDTRVIRARLHGHKDSLSLIHI